MYDSAVMNASVRERSNSMVQATPGNEYVGNLVGTGMKFGIVVGRFNDLVTKLLLEGALDHFERHGVPREDVDVRFVFMHTVAFFVIAFVCGRMPPLMYVPYMLCR